MAANKTKLKADLITWMAKGEAGDFKLLADGVEYFRGIVESYASDAADTYENKIQAFTAAELATQLLLLAPGEETDLPATQLALGLNLAFTAKQLATTNLPLTFDNPVSVDSNQITSPVTASDTQQDFKDILDLGFNEIFDSLDPDNAKFLFRQYLSNLWADTIEKGVTKSTWQMSYTNNPTFISPTPGNLISGKLK